MNSFLISALIYENFIYYETFIMLNIINKLRRNTRTIMFIIYVIDIISFYMNSYLHKRLINTDKL